MHLTQLPMKIVKLLSINFLILIIFSLNLFSQNSIIDYFHEELTTKDFDFKIIDAKFKIKTIFGKQKLKLKNYNLEEIYPNIYKLTLYFKKKKGIFNFKEKQEIYFFYNKRVIVFKTDYGKRKYEINLFKYVKYEVKYNRCIRRVSPVRFTFKLKMKKGKIYLTFEFFRY